MTRCFGYDRANSAEKRNAKTDDIDDGDQNNIGGILVTTPFMNFWLIVAFASWVTVKMLVRPTASTKSLATVELMLYTVVGAGAK